MSEDKRRLIRTQGRFSGNGSSEGAEEKESKYDNRHKGRRSNERKFHGKHQSGERPENQATFDDSPNMKKGSDVPSNDFGVEYEENSVDDVLEFKATKKPKMIAVPGWHILSQTSNGESRVFYLDNLIKPVDGYGMMDTLKKQIKWYDKNIVIHGRVIPQPRLVAWFGPLPYSYSGVMLEPQEFPEIVLEIKKEVEKVLREQDIDVNLNSVLLNLYRDGKDGVAWHSDDELSMGICPTIASVSLGEIRRFEMRRKYVEKRRSSGQSYKYENQMSTDNTPEYVIHLKHGSLVVMDGVMQKDWQHRVPKEYHDKAARINLTFRTVYKIESIPYPRGGITKESPQHNDKPKISPKASMLEIDKDKYEDDFPEISPKENKKVVGKQARVDRTKVVDSGNNLNSGSKPKAFDKKLGESNGDCEVCNNTLLDINRSAKILKQNMNNEIFSWRDQLEFQFLFHISNCAEYLSSACRTLLYNRMKFYQLVISEGWKFASSHKFTSKHSCNKSKEVSINTSGLMNIPVHYNDEDDKRNIGHDTELLDLIAVTEGLLNSEEQTDQDYLELELVLSVAKHDGYLPTECRHMAKNALQRFSHAATYGWKYIQDSYIQQLRPKHWPYGVQNSDIVNSNTNVTFRKGASTSLSETAETSGNNSPEHMDISEIGNSPENLSSTNSLHRVQNNEVEFDPDISNEHDTEVSKCRETELQRLIDFIESDWDSPNWCIRDHYELNYMIPIAKHAVVLPHNCQDLLIERLKYFEGVLNGKYKNYSKIYSTNRVFKSSNRRYGNSSRYK